ADSQKRETGERARHIPDSADPSFQSEGRSRCRYGSAGPFGPEGGCFEGEAAQRLPARAPWYPEEGRGLCDFQGVGTTVRTFVAPPIALLWRGWFRLKNEGRCLCSEDQSVGADDSNRPRLPDRCPGFQTHSRAGAVKAGSTREAQPAPHQIGGSQIVRVKASRSPVQPQESRDIQPLGESRRWQRRPP